MTTASRRAPGGAFSIPLRARPSPGQPARALAAALVCASALAFVPAPARADAAVREAADASITRAAAFLIATQNENGSFGRIPGAPEPGEIGITGLVMRGLGGLPKHLQTDPTRASLARATAYLKARQQPNGSFSPPGTGLATYRTALGITALIAVDPVAHADAIRRARVFLEGSQFSETHGLDPATAQASPHYGGFGYDKTGARPDADLSNTHLAIEALRQAGVPEDSEVWKRAVIFLQRCQNRSESNDLDRETVVIGDDGGFMYDPGLDLGKSEPVERADGKATVPSYASMTYAGLMSMLNANLDKEDPRVQAAWAWITRHYTLTENYGLGSRKNPRATRQGLYYYYHAFAKALSAWGEAEVVDAAGERHRWADELCLHLAALQREDGSWINDEPRWWENDPVLVTGYVLLALDVAYPWLEGGAAGAKEPAVPDTQEGDGKGAPAPREEAPGGR